MFLTDTGRDFPNMTVQQRKAGSDDLQIPGDSTTTDKNGIPQEPSIRPADLRTLIQNRKDSEKQLNLRLSLVQEIIEGADSAIFSIDAEFCYSSYNKRHARDMQDIYGSEIAAGQKIAGFVPVEKDLQKLLGLFRQALAGEQGVISDYFGDNARSRRYFDLSYYPVRTPAGVIAGAAVIATDTTLRKKSERSLAEREERFRRLAEDSPDFLYRMTIPEGKYEYVSPGSLAFTGYTMEEFSHKPGLLYDLVPSFGKDAFGRHLELLIKGKTPPPAEFQIVHRNGDLRWGLLRSTLIRDAAGHPVAVEGVVTDITDGKKEQIALAGTEEWYRTVFEVADTGIVLVDTETQVIADANPRAVEMIGAPREKIIGEVCHRYICPAETGRRPVTVDPGERGDGAERFILAADGRRIPVLMNDIPVTIAGRKLIMESFIDLSEWKKTEDTLRQSEEQYRTFIENSSEGIFRYAADCEIPVTLPVDEQIDLVIRHGYLAECNTALARMYGYEQAGELAGQKLTTLVDVEDPSTLEYLRTFIQNGYHSTDYETEERDRNGNTRWFATSMNAVIRDGCVVNLWGVKRDSTDRRKCEITLQESEARYRGLVEHSGDIIFTLSCSGDITSISPGVLPLSGYQPDELIGKNIRELVTPEYQQSVEEYLDRKKNLSGSGACNIVEIRTKDGGSLPFEVKTRIRSEGRKIPDIIGNAREIAERKKNEDELRESEERFRTLLQCVPSVAVLGFLPDYTVTSWNEATTRIFGYTRDDAMGKDVRDLLVPADAREVFTETCDSMAATGTPTPSPVSDLMHKDGTRVPVFISHAVVKIPGRSTNLFCFSVDLTEQKKAETALRDAEWRLQSVLDAAPYGTVVYELRNDKDLVFVWGNQSASRILGTDCTRFIGKTIEDAFPALASTGIPDIYRKVIRDGAPFHNEAFDHGTEDISGIYEIHAVPLAQNRLTVFFRDVSEQKKADADLKSSETRFRALIQNSPEIIQILDRENRLVCSTMAFSKILGYPQGSQNSRCLLDLVHPDDRERVAADLGEVSTRTNPGTPTEYRMVTADGNYRYVESVGVNLLGVPGVEGIVINTHLVHERKQAEQALSESEERFRLIFQHSNDAIYLFGITPSGMPGKIVDANDMATRQTGFAKDELVHKTLRDLCSRNFSQQSRAIMMELLTRGVARFETEKIKKDGSLLPVEISARLVKLKEKTFVIAISRDISQKKREARALHIASQKLQLMNIVAWHEIQNKVTGLREYGGLFKDLVPDEKLKKFIDREDDLLRVISRHLQYTTEYREIGIQSPQWVNLPQVLRMIVSSGEMGSVKCSIDLPDLELHCDPAIGKVFSHLIENTRQHGGKVTEIHISSHETAEGLVLIYEDDGAGIPRERKKDLFVRGEGAATGSSLFFVHDILEISDMTIQETGEPQKGARFEISVPRGLYRFGREEA